MEDEVKNAPYTNDDPFSNATSFRKIIEYIYLCVVDENVSREEAKAWLCDLYKNQSKHDHAIFCSRVDAIISAIEYLKMNNKIV
nr:hypothetical protein [uncultured Prevotella sp.]